MTQERERDGGGKGCTKVRVSRTEHGKARGVPAAQNQGKRENAMPLDFFVRELGKWGFRADGVEYAKATFVAPCTIMMVANVADLMAARKRLNQPREAHHHHQGSNVSVTPPYGPAVRQFFFFPRPGSNSAPATCDS